MPENLPAPTNIIAAAFTVPDDAVRAIGALQDHGIAARQISVATPRPPAGNGGIEDDDADDTRVLSSEAAHATPVLRDRDGFLEVQTEDPPTPGDMNAVTEDRRGSSSTHDAPDNPIAAEGERGLTTTTPEDAARGAAVGGVAGLGLGILAGAAALMIPGVGPILAAGPLWLAIAGTVGATAAGAVTGGVVGYLQDLGVPAGVAHHHAEGLTRGSVVVAVHLDPNDKPETVSAILHKYGGFDVATHDTA